VELPPEILPLVNALRKNTAAQLASLSGGDYFLFKSRTAFDEDLQKISNQIRNYYLLSFQPKAGAEAGLHTIQVKLKGVPDAVVQTRRSYWLAAR
jgi:hypothetical protein